MRPGRRYGWIRAWVKPPEREESSEGAFQRKMREIAEKHSGPLAVVS